MSGHIPSQSTISDGIRWLTSAALTYFSMGVGGMVIFFLGAATYYRAANVTTVAIAAILALIVLISLMVAIIRQYLGEARNIKQCEIRRIEAVHVIESEIAKLEDQLGHNHSADEAAEIKSNLSYLNSLLEAYRSFKKFTETLTLRRKLEERIIREEIQQRSSRRLLGRVRKQRENPLDRHEIKEVPIDSILEEEKLERIRSIRERI